ncbi:sigma-70 family RNA polymerase sigma factor [Kitasatospora sp. NPDC058170]|uniref:sigma-70 family RNA polymerase sigma factor n=1 Tax=Kitasatospora sp. NPDC058170 TaxID=3346364 RepID=UPI0036DBDB14
MIDLTEQQIADAKANDLGAVTAVIQATEERVTQLARRYASTGGRTDPELVEDLAQVGRIAVWEAVSRFRGTTVAEFFTFIDRTLKGAMSDERKEETRQGVSRQAAADYERALSIAGGDPYEAEFLATTAEAMGARKMSPEGAYAARLAYQGVEYLDAPLKAGSDSAEDFATLADTIVSETGIPEDLLEAADFVSVARNRTGKKVHRTLRKMSTDQKVVLMALTGIDPIGYFGTENDDELAAFMGLSRPRVSVVRSKAKDRFASLWIDLEWAA